MKYNKIMTVVLGFTLILVLGMGGVLAGVFPNPFVLNGNDDVNVIYGASSADAAGANAIGNNLIATWDAQQPVIIGDDDVTEIVIGDESYLIQSHGNDLNLLEALNGVESKLTDDELPVLLANGDIKFDDGDDIEYTQELILGENSIGFSSLDDEDYIVNEDFASNRMPMLYMNLVQPTWTLEVDFEKTANFADGELDDNAKIIIAGQEYTIDPNLDSSDDLLLYESAQEVTIKLLETKVVTLDGEEVSITVSGADPDSDEAILIIDGEHERAWEGRVINVNGEKIYVNEVFIQTIPDDSVLVELFIGADEVVIKASDTYQSIKVNGDTLDGVKAKLNTNSIAAFRTISFEFNPIKMDEDDFEEGLEFLELGESITDPLFGTIAMTFEGVSSELDSDDRDFIELNSRSDELQMTFTNIDGNEIIFTPYIEDEGIRYSDNLIINQPLIGLTEDDEFILQISGDITDIFRIDDIDYSDGEVEIYSYAEDSSEIYEEGDVIDGTSVSVDSIDEGSVTLDGVGHNMINTENLMQITLETSELIFDEIEMDGDESPVHAVVVVSLGLDEGDIEITSVDSPDILQSSDEDNDYEYSITEGFGTYFVRNDDTDRIISVYVPETEMDFDVYVSAGVEIKVVSNDTDTDDTPSLLLGDIVFTDSSADMSNDNIIVVGGPCVNQVSARLLGSSTPVCGEEFTALTGVGEGSYGIFAFANPDNADKVAILVAGYEVEDTTNGVNALLGDDFTLPAVGEKFIV